MRHLPFHKPFAFLLVTTAFANVSLGGETLLAAAAEVRIYPAPPAEAEEASKDYGVTVESQAVPVTLVRVAVADPKVRDAALRDTATVGDTYDRASMASFDMNGPVTVTVTSPTPIQTAKILPTSYGIVPRVDGSKLTFTLPQPRLLTIEINGNWNTPLHLFANPFEVDPPRPDDPNVIYLAPGLHDVNDVGLKATDGKTVYLAGGAVLRGNGKGGPLVALAGRHVTLRGRGIIDGTRTPVHSRSLVTLVGSDLVMEGVTLLDCGGFNMPIRRCDRVAVSGVKIFGYRSNSDAIDICNSRDVTVDGCFLRTSDDLVVIKTDKGQGPLWHVVAKNCVLWSQLAHSLSVGAELCESVDDVLFTDCDIIHDKGREWSMRVYHCDNALINNVRFENIRLEEAPRPISLWIGKAVWSLTEDRGNIRNVLFKNIRGTAAVPLKIELQGFDATHTIQGVRFEDVQFNGQPLTEGDVKRNAFVLDVVVQP